MAETREEPENQFAEKEAVIKSLRADMEAALTMRLRADMEAARTKRLLAEKEAVIKRIDDGFRWCKYSGLPADLEAARIKMFDLSCVSGHTGSMDGDRPTLSDDGFRESWYSDFRSGDDGYRPWNLSADRKEVRIKGSDDGFRWSKSSEWLTEETARTKGLPADLEAACTKFLEQLAEKEALLKMIEVSCQDICVSDLSGNSKEVRIKRIDDGFRWSKYSEWLTEETARTKGLRADLEAACTKMFDLSCVSGDTGSMDGNRPTLSDDGFRESWYSDFRSGDDGYRPWNLSADRKEVRIKRIDDGFRWSKYSEWLTEETAFTKSRRCGDDGYRPWNEDYLDGQEKISIREIY